MSRVVLVADPGSSGLMLQRCGWLDRLVVRARSVRLDRALAGGAGPDSSYHLSLRAQALLRASTRRRLARELRNVIAAAQRPHYLFDSTVPLARRQILAARELIEHAADWLAGSAPAGVRGIARARLLLCDGAGALFTPSDGHGLERAVLAIVDGLEPLADVQAVSDDASGGVVCE